MSSVISSLKELHGHLTGTTAAFASWRMPGQQEPVTILSTRGFYPLPDVLPPDQNPGFILAPFLPGSPPVWINADRTFRGFTFPEVSVDDYPAAAETPYTLPYEAGKTEYLKQLREAIARLRKGEAQKVVLSRAIIIDFSNPSDASLLFHGLCKMYPDAFVYLAGLPGQGLWAGATPEVLVKAEGGKITTMALAGTRKAGSASTWGEKEIAEHEWVSRYISEKLEGAGATGIRTSGPETITAGKAEHLKTGFKALLPQENLNALLRALHPTPAVCGWSRDEALQIIAETEKHDRAYYAGYLGPVNSNGNMDLFVNLRCLQIRGGKGILYAGGGITTASDPEAEWDETVLKSSTILAATGKFMNLAYS
jgi:isochorismate synthase